MLLNLINSQAQDIFHRYAPTHSSEDEKLLRLLRLYSLAIVDRAFRERSRTNKQVVSMARRAKALSIERSKLV